MHHPNPLQPNLIVDYLSNMLQMPNLAIQCIAEAGVPSTATIESSLQPIPPFLGIFDKKLVQPSQIQKHTVNSNIKLIEFN